MTPPYLHSSFHSTQATWVTPACCILHQAVVLLFGYHCRSIQQTVPIERDSRPLLSSTMQEQQLLVNSFHHLFTYATHTSLLMPPTPLYLCHPHSSPMPLHLCHHTLPTFYIHLVPNNDGFPTTPPLGTALPVDTQIFIEVDGADIAYVISEMARRGYKVVSLSSYRFGYNLETTFDVTFSNSSLVDTVPYIQLTECQLLAQIDGLRGQGYSVVSISGRVAADGLLYYTGVFRISAPIMETKVYLRDSVSVHLQRLVDLKASGYQLVAQSLETVGHVVEACSIYTRDIRLDYNISINTKPLDWTSFFNASFYQFTGNLLRAVSRYNPIHVDMYYGADNRSSLFSAVLLGYTQSQWFLWGLNYSSTLAEVASMKQYWEPIISLGYSYLGSAVHYVQWQQKSPPEYVMNIVKPKSGKLHIKACVACS